jgi:hypothetical protein
MDMLSPLAFSKQVETEPEVNIHNVIELLIKKFGNKKAA